MPSGCAFAHNHHNNVLAVPKISIPEGKQFCTAKTSAAADLIQERPAFFLSGGGAPAKAQDAVPQYDLPVLRSAPHRRQDSCRQRTSRLVVFIALSGLLLVRLSIQHSRRRFSLKLKQPRLHSVQHRIPLQTILYGFGKNMQMVPRKHTE